MAVTLTDLQTQLDAALAKEATIAGVSRTGFSDQYTEFDLKGLRDYISTLKQQINALQRGTSSRYAATTKGL